MNYRLDSNTWIALLSRKNAGVLVELKQRSPDTILLCSVVLAELWYGAARSDAHRRDANFALVDQLQDKYISLPFDDAAAREYAEIRAVLVQQGKPNGPNDVLIAAIARSQGVTLVTHNVREFGRVPNLLAEDWPT